MKVTCILILLHVAVATSSFSQNNAPLRQKHFNLEKGVAVEGYDPVSYFRQNKAVKGRAEFSVVADGVTYQFSTAANQELFKKNPSMYQPQYGGWCAYAMGAKGEKVEVDPETFKILNGKLYLFYNSYFNNTLKSWNKNEINLKTNADLSWMKIFN